MEETREHDDAGENAAIEGKIEVSEESTTNEVAVKEEGGGEGGDAAGGGDNNDDEEKKEGEEKGEEEEGKNEDVDGGEEKKEGEGEGEDSSEDNNKEEGAEEEKESGEGAAAANGEEKEGEEKTEETNESGKTQEDEDNEKKQQEEEEKRRQEEEEAEKKRQEEEEEEKKRQEEEEEKKRLEEEAAEKKRQEEEEEKKRLEEEEEKKRQEEEEAEKKRQEEEAEKKRLEEEAEKKRLEEEEAAEKKRQEEEAEQKKRLEEEEAEKKRLEEEEAAAEKKRQEEEAEKKRQEEEEAEKKRQEEEEAAAAEKKRLEEEEEKKRQEEEEKKRLKEEEAEKKRQEEEAEKKRQEEEEKKRQEEEEKKRQEEEAAAAAAEKKRQEEEEAEKKRQEEEEAEKKRQEEAAEKKRLEEAAAAAAAENKNSEEATTSSTEEPSQQPPTNPPRPRTDDEEGLQGDFECEEERLLTETIVGRKKSGVLDAYGFAVPHHCVDAYRKQTQLQAERREQSKLQWQILMNELGEKPGDIRRLLRSAVVSGIPVEYRPRLWPLLCGVPVYKQQRPGLYDKLVLKASKMDPHSQIILDLDRTFPGHPLLETSEGMAALQRVLTAYALFDPAVGYCQSTNFMVGLMLIMDVTEEDAFWMLVHISRVLLPEYFAPPMLGASVDHAVFRKLLCERMPEVAAKVESLHVDIAILSAQWFLCIFANRIPCETVCRIWDVVFCRGPPAMFQIALAIISLCSDRLLKAEDMGEVMHSLRHAEISLFDADSLLETAFTQFPDVVDISGMRAAMRPEVLEQYKQYRNRVNPSTVSVVAEELRQNASKAMDQATSAFSKLRDMQFALPSLK